MAQWLSALTPLAEDLGLIPRMHMAAKNPLRLGTHRKEENFM